LASWFDQATVDCYNLPDKKRSIERKMSAFAPYFQIIVIIISTALVVAILLQSKGAGLGGIFGGETGSLYKTRRGAEKYLFNATIGLSVAFFVFVILTFLAVG
jgi:preprotein translocase subunit SecG